MEVGNAKNVKEIKVEDMVGKFISPLISGSKRFVDAKWILARIILSNKNIWMVGKNIKKRIPLPSIIDLGGRLDLNQEIAKTPFYLLIRHTDNENHISLITGSRKDLERFKNAIIHVILNGKIVYVKYPVKKGGVVQTNVNWEKAQIVIKDNKLRLVTESGKLIKIEPDKIQLLRREDREFNGEMKKVIDIQFNEFDRESNMEYTVECYIYGRGEILNIIHQFIYSGFDKVSADIQLSDVEKQIIMSLYTGVSPFEIPSFLGLDVEKVEEIYDRLIKLGVLKEVRKRKEVTLTMRGKNLASEALSE